MKKWFLGVLILSCVLGSTYAIAQNNTAYIVDGSLNDWKQPLRFYDQESKLSYAISNDQESFYLAIEATDEMLVHRLLFDGFQISINPKGKNKKQMYVNYRPVSRQRISHDSTIVIQKENKLEKKEDRVQHFIDAMRFEVVGFSDITDNSSYSFSELDPLSLKIVSDSVNHLILEFSIPFSSINYLPKGKDVAIGIYLPKPSMVVAPPAVRPVPPDGEGRPDFNGSSQEERGMPSGGRPPGGMGQRPMEGEISAQSVSELDIWKKYTPNYMIHD